MFIFLSSFDFEKKFEVKCEVYSFMKCEVKCEVYSFMNFECIRREKGYGSNIINLMLWTHKIENNGYRHYFEGTQASFSLGKKKGLVINYKLIIHATFAIYFCYLCIIILCIRARLLLLFII